MGERIRRHSYPPAFGRELEELRQRHGFTQEDISLAVGMHRTAIIKIEAANQAQPMRQSFYQGLMSMEGVTEDEVATLLFANMPEGIKAAARRRMFSPLPGIEVTIFPEPTTTPEQINLFEERIRRGVNDFDEQRTKKEDIKE